MRESTREILNELVLRYPSIEVCKNEIDQAVESLIACFNLDGKLLACGNGGSAADCEHIVGELMKAFLLKRRLEPEKQSRIRSMYPEDADVLIQNLQRAVPAISLVSQTALMTAFGNDASSQLLFAQQVLSYGRPGDVLLAISTSGNSSNILYAAQIARLQGVKIIGLTGENGGKLKALCDVAICVPASLTYQIQELHLPVYHCLCACVENELFGGDEK